MFSQRKGWKTRFYNVNNSPQLITTFNTVFLKTTAGFAVVVVAVTAIDKLHQKNLYGLKHQYDTTTHLLKMANIKNIDSIKCW